MQSQNKSFFASAVILMCPVCLQCAEGLWDQGSLCRQCGPKVDPTTNKELKSVQHVSISGFVLLFDHTGYRLGVERLAHIGRVCHHLVTSCSIESYSPPRCTCSLCSSQVGHVLYSQQH